MNFRSGVCALGLILAAVSFVFTGSARAQADFTARRPADVTVFGGYNDTKPDFGATHDNGVTFGAEYNRSLGWRVIPGLEARVNLNSGPDVKEHSYLVGPRAHVNLNRYRLHPYADFLVGLGTITYPGYSGTVNDSGLEYSYGGGLDIDLVKNLALRGDYQFANWNLGQNAFIKPNGQDFTLFPTTLTIGFSYRIPFRSWTDQKHR